MEHKEKDSKRFIIPGGAGLAAICFFAPWIRACKQDISGFQMASHGESSVWLILIAAIAIVGCFFWYGEEKNNLKTLKPIVLLGGLLGLLILMIKYAQFEQQGRGMFEIRYGLIGTLIGFIASLCGLRFLEDKTDSVPKVETDKSIRNAAQSENQSQESIPCIDSPTSALPRLSINFCPECGAKVNSEDSFCQNCGQSLKEGINLALKGRLTNWD